MEREALKQVAVDWIEQVWRPGGMAAFERLHAADFVDGGAPEGRATGRDSYRASIEALYVCFPDFYTRIEDLVVDVAAGEVAIRWSAQGTHRAQFMQYVPGGQVVHFRGIEIIRVVGGQIVARWGEWDFEHIERQLRAHAEKNSGLVKNGQAEV